MPILADITDFDKSQNDTQRGTSTGAQTLDRINRAYRAKVDRSAQPLNLLEAALWYAKHGYHIFPLIPGTKEPATSNGLYGATTDLEQVKRWWKQNSRYNIGINCGASGLLVGDADTYKTNATDGSIEWTNTVTVNTAHHGTHHWYKMPDGKQYGNARGSLPKWLDIRGFGGYVVAPPSVLIEDGEELPYAFAPNRKPTDIEIADLPAVIADALEAAQVALSAVPVNFAAGNTPEPNLTQWWMPDDVLTLIHDGASKGERSEADFRVILALAKAGATDDDIRAVFVHFAIGEKYGERGDKYLAHSIGKARAWLEEHPANPPIATAELASMRGWVRGPDCLAKLRLHSRRVAELVLTLDGLCEMAKERRSFRVSTTMRDVADRCGVSASTAHSRLERLEVAGLIKLTRDQYGTIIDLDPTRTLSGSVKSVRVGSTSEDDFFADHRCDDAFTTYPYSYAIRRRQVPTVLLRSLGASGLLLWDALGGSGTVKELAEETGLTVACVRVTLKKFEAVGLLLTWLDGRANVHELHPNAEERLEERREHMVTAGIGQLRAARNANDKARFAHRKLQSRMPIEPREKARLENRRAQSDAKVDAYYESLTRMGINPYAKVAHRSATTIVQEDWSGFSEDELAALDPDKPIKMPRPETLRFDASEEWRSWGRDMWEVLELLGDCGIHDKIRLLTISEVGEDASEEVYRAARREINERVDIALSLAPRRAILERTYTYPDVEEDAVPQPTMPVMHPSLYEMTA
jgi:DNA-binding MarR family transcriptional regulator